MKTTGAGESEKAAKEFLDKHVYDISKEKENNKVGF